MATILFEIGMTRFQMPYQTLRCDEVQRTTTHACLSDKQTQCCTTLKSGISFSQMYLEH